MAALQNPVPPRNPMNYEAFQTRLKSYTIIKWFSRPNELSPIVCSVKGWRCEKMESLHCDFCNKSLAVVIPKNGYEFYKRTIESLQERLTSEHRTGCIWKYGLDIPDYFITGEPVDGTRLEDRLLSNCKEIYDDKEAFIHIKEFKQMPYVQDSAEILNQFAERHAVDIASLTYGLHGWKLRTHQTNEKILECSICSREIIARWKDDAVEAIDLTQHLGWCPWVHSFKANTPPLVKRMVQHVLNETNMKRKRDSLNYRSSQQRKEEVKQITKFMRSSLA